MFKLIDALITKQGFALESWDDRYSKGVWVTLSPSEYLTGRIMSSSSDGDLDMIPTIEFVLSTQWMPVVTGRTFLESMEELEKLLESLPPEMLVRGSKWAVAVNDALEHLRDVQDEHKGYGATDGKFLALPETFAQVLAAASQSA